MISISIPFNEERSVHASKPQGAQTNDIKKIFYLCALFLSVIIVITTIGSFNYSIVYALSIRQPNLGSNKAPEYISNFVIVQEGENNQCRFSLKDEDYAYTTAAGTVTIKFLDSEESILYENTFSITKSDFGTYELVLTGEDFIAYVWSFSQASVEKGYSPGKAILEFRSGGWIWTIEED